MTGVDDGDLVDAVDVTVSAQVFLAARHLVDVAVLFEPVRLRRGVEHTYGRVSRSRDEIVATVTVFRTRGDLDRGQPTQIFRSVTVGYPTIVRALESALADHAAVAAVIRRVATRIGPYYALDDVDAEVGALVQAYRAVRG
jgi:hypothetical protein